MPSSSSQPKKPTTTNPDFPDRPFHWTRKSEDAALLLAEDEFTDEAIAAQARITRSTLSKWKRHPEFAAQIREHVAEFQERAREAGLGRLDKRMAAYNDRHRRMTQLITARGDDMAEESPDGETGLLVRQLKRVLHVYEPDPHDEEGELVEQTELTAEYLFDAALMRELRELEKQIAQDTGQWSEKREVSGPDGGAVVIREIRVPRPEGDS